MKLSLFYIYFAALSVALPACQSDQQKISTPPPAQSKVSSGDDGSDGSDGDDLSVKDEEPTKKSSTCKPKSCKKITIKMTMKSPTSSGKLSTFVGSTNTRNSVMFLATPSEDREVAITVLDLPYGAESDEQGENVTINWTPESETSGSFEVRARDVSRCKELEKDDSDCSDIEASGFEQYETTETFPYQIKIDAAAKAEKERKEAEEKAKDAKCKAAMIQAGLGAVGGLIGTTTTTTTGGQSTSTTQSTVNGGAIVNSVGGAVVNCM